MAVVALAQAGTHANHGDAWGFVIIGMSLLGMFLVLLWLRDHKGPDDEDGGGGGWGRPPNDPPPGPSWWPEFEREFAAYAGAAARRGTRTPGGDPTCAP
jgi:hypothetical protein